MSTIEKATSTLTLYTNPMSRASMIEWYLEEIGVEAELITVDMTEKDHKKPDFLQINPFGALPALQDGGFVLIESGAILLYLAEKYGGVTALEERAKLSVWTHFANATVIAIAFNEEFRQRYMAEAMGVLDRLLAEKEYLEGAFSAADISVGMYLMYIPAFAPQVDLSPYPNVIRYMHRLVERPACVKTTAPMLVQATKALGGSTEPAAA